MAVVGAGAMGCLFAASLERSGNDVLLVHNNPRAVSEVGRRGVRLRGLDGRTRSVRVRIVLGPVDLRGFDFAVFAVKAYDTGAAAKLYRRRVGPGTAVLSLQNGLGNVEVLSEILGERRVIAGSTTEGALLLGPGVVAHTGRGRTVVGEIDGSLSRRCSDFVRMFQGAGFRAAVTGNVEGVVWCKAVVNSAVNPVSALTRLRNGELVGDAGLRSVMLAVVEEGVRVAKAEGVRLEPADPGRLLLRTLRATGGNMSSMLQDVLNGRRTEIRELNGRIMERGERLGIRTPYNQVLTSLVLGLERSYVSRHA